MSTIRKFYFCHTADWHLDYFQYHKRERWQDFFKAANDCAKAIIEEKPDFVIHCGDFFHHFRPSPGALRLSIRILEKFKKAGIPFYVIRGNHDASKAQVQRFGGTILRLLEDLGYLFYIQDEMVQINDCITFTGIGEYGKTTGTVIEEVLRNNPPDDKKYNILALHGYVQGQVSDSIYDITSYELASTGFNYIALGHYHKLWFDKENNLFCPGSTEQTSLNDWGEPDADGFFREAGYFSVKIEGSPESGEWKTEASRKEFNIRPKGRFHLNLGENADIDQILERANTFIKSHDLDGAILRFDFTGKLPPGKQKVINLSHLPSIKEAKALHVIVSQNFTTKALGAARSGLSPIDALNELLDESYDFSKKEVSMWTELTEETVKALGHKTISSEEAEAIQSIYKLISDMALEIKKAKGKKPLEKKKRAKTATTKAKTATKTKSRAKTAATSKEPIKTVPAPTVTKTERKTPKQTKLSLFLEEGEKE